MTPEFVAEARRVYVPAARWMRENPDWDRPRLCRWDRSIAIHCSEGWYMGKPHEEMLVIRDVPPTRETFRPRSITQAIDYLADADVIPAGREVLAKHGERKS